MSNSIIIPLDQLKATLQGIQDSLNKKYDHSEGGNMLELLGELASLLGNSSLAEASAKYWLEAAKKKAYDEYILANPEQKTRLMPLNLKEYIGACCAAEQAAYTLAESQHSSLVHMIDAVRSSLSYLKAELNNINN